MNTRLRRVTKIVLWLLCLALAAFVALNVLARNHAYSMTHFTAGGEKTKKAEDLSRLQKCRVLISGPNIPRPANTRTPADFGLPFAVHRFPSDSNMTIEAWYIPLAEPRGAVLACPGWAAARSSLLPEVKAFRELGYSVFLMDFRGSGGSSLNETTIGWREADDVAAAFGYLRRLAAEDAPLIIYGQSMGGAAALRSVAVNNIKPSAVIIEGVFDTLLSAVRNRFRLMGVPSFPSAELLVFWGSRETGIRGFRHNPADYAASVACPALVLHGADDPRATPEQAQRIFDNLAGKKAFERFPAVRHESCVAVDPERWKSAVAGFLSGL